MSEFDKWFEGEMPNSHKKVNKERIETVIYSCAEASWQHQQAKIDDLQAKVGEVLIEMKNQLGDEDFYDMERPDYDAMLYALRNIKDILK